MISGLKAFFTYLLLEKIIREDPMELIDTPRIGRKLPDVLTPDEVLRIITDYREMVGIPESVPEAFR